MAKHFDRHSCGKCHLSFKLDPATIKANLAELAKKNAGKAKAEAAPVEKEVKKDDGKKGKKGKKK